MGKRIKEAYKKAGVDIKRAVPKGGRGVHTLKGHKCVISYLKKGLSRKEAWKRCIGGLGKHAIKKSHRKTV